MASLLTDVEKTAVNSALSDMHDTFARDIHVYVEEASSIPVELNYNPLYGRRKDTSKISSENTLTRYRDSWSDIINIVTRCCIRFFMTPQARNKSTPPLRRCGIDVSRRVASIPHEKIE